MQIGNPRTLILLGTLPGGNDLEARIHDTFAGSLVRGEWFEASRALLAFVRSHCTDWLTSVG